ncbi:unnamed protein product [Menidia menidia]|uniref:(Atlantic silverside) hypothetical protein n=1 Tax=Menidia menidia TaxID=238744 RepID=A0A8S4ASJ5_9TELE|nr:unnamed protein product [Menidia menidia]
MASITREDFSELENFSEMISFKSMEDLVNEFDEKLNVCFHNYNTKTEGLAPIRNQGHSQEEEERLQDEDVWDALTDNYISAWDGPKSEGLNGNLSDQEVIEEIVEMMENSPDPGETEEEDEEEVSHSSSRTSPSLLEEIRQLVVTRSEAQKCVGTSVGKGKRPGLSLMPGPVLLDLLHRVESAIRGFSEELVGQLARRDELEFEKEVKNSFITALMEVQNRQREQRDGSRRRRRDKALSLQGGGGGAEGGATVAAGNARTGAMPVKGRCLGGQLAFGWRLAGVRLAVNWRPFGVHLASSWRPVSVQLPFGWRSTCGQLAVNWR